MYEIVGFDEIVGAAGAFPPHSTQGLRHPHHALAAGLEPAVIGDEMYAGDALISGADLIAGLAPPALMSGADPAEQLLAIAGLGGGAAPYGYPALSPWSPYHAAMAGLTGLTAPAVQDHAIRAAMMRNFAPRTIDVRSRAARAPRRLVLNFRSLGVAPNNTVDLPARPQLPFRPERLFVQSDIAGNFELVDIIVGNRSQFAQATPMSARIAAETSFGFDLHMDTAMVAMDVVLRIANITGAPSDFRATIVGTSAIP